MNHLLEQTLIEQNPHWAGERYNHAFKRSHDSILLNELGLREIQIITGIRRCGKSTLLQTIINHLLEQGNIKNILYINFDDPNYNEACNDPSSFYSILTAAEKLMSCNMEYLFLDEVQNVDAWEKYVKSVYDSKRFKKIFISGSNAELLKSNSAKLLTGRYIETHIYPLSFQEVVLNNNINNQYELIKQKPLVLNWVDNMLNFGGFPRIWEVEEDIVRRKILQSYYETILLKDCVANNKIRDVKAMMNLAHYLINNISNLYSYNSLHKALGSNETTIQNFIQVLQDAYLIEEIKNFSFSLKQKSKAKKKAYCIDNGLINATTFKFSKNYGKLLENLVFCELKKRYQKNIYFYNDQIECDFIVHDEERVAIQVCYQLDLESREREIRGLSTAMQHFAIPNGLIITYNQEERLADNMLAIPFWKWAVASA